jgi:hypothetical protein
VHDCVRADGVEGAGDGGGIEHVEADHVWWVDPV